jgi:cytochrome c2
MRKLSLIMLLSMTATAAQASHSFGGLDMCALYPEVMPPGMPLEQLPEAESVGALALQRYCTQCHELPGPGRHTLEEWPEVLARMNTLMAVANRFGGLLGKVKTPTPAEYRQLVDYLNRHSLHALNTQPEGLGASAFTQHCSACHALPDPAQHSVSEWSAVIKRMQRNMQIMRYDAPSADSLMQIQFYLQTGQAAGSALAEPRTPASAEHGSRFKAIALALGPFLLLVIIGLLRWRIGHNKNHLAGAK